MPITTAHVPPVGTTPAKGLWRGAGGATVAAGGPSKTAGGGVTGWSAGGASAAGATGRSEVSGAVTICASGSGERAERLTWGAEDVQPAQRSARAASVHTARRATVFPSLCELPA